MSAVADKKEKIYKILDKMPEAFLDTLLTYLEELKEEASEEDVLMQHFDKIMEEDYNLLKRLAQ